MGEKTIFKKNLAFSLKVASLLCVVGLAACLPEKNPIETISLKNFPNELVDFPVSNIEDKIWAGLVGARPLSLSVFGTCYRFTEIAQGNAIWASGIYNFVSSWSQDRPHLGDHVQRIEVFFPLNGSNDEIVSNYAIVQLTVANDYFDDKKAWGPIANFAFPTKDFRELGNTFSGATISQLVVLRGYNASDDEFGDSETLELNFGSSFYATRLRDAEPPAQFQARISDELIARNASFIESSIFESRWQKFVNVGTLEHLFSDVPSNKEVRCGETDDENLKAYQSTK